MKKEVTWLLLTLAGAFVLLALAVVLFPHQFLDALLMLGIQQHRNHALNAVMHGISLLGQPEAIMAEVGLAAAFCGWRGLKAEALCLLLTAVPSLLNLGLKRLFQVQRPDFPGLEVLGDASNDGFPSGHALHAVLFFGFLLVLLVSRKAFSLIRRRLVLSGLSLLMLLMPFSRVYLGLHWLTDVLGGLLLGLLCLVLLSSYYLYLRQSTRT